MVLLVYGTLLLDGGKVCRAAVMQATPAIRIGVISSVIRNDKALLNHLV